MTGDTVKEPNETIVVELLYPLHATIATPTGTGTITDDDTTPGLSISSPRVTEGDSGSADLTYTVSLTAASTEQVTVNYADAGTGTATSGTDYTAITGGTLTFAVGATSQDITVSVTGDTDVEPHETVAVSLSSAANATISTATGTGTIVNDDGASSLSVSSLSVTEADTAIRFHGDAEHGALGVCAGDLVGHGRGHRDRGAGLRGDEVQQPRRRVADLRSG